MCTSQLLHKFLCYTPKIFGHFRTVLYFTQSDPIVLELMKDFLVAVFSEEIYQFLASILFYLVLLQLHKITTWKIKFNLNINSKYFLLYFHTGTSSLKVSRLFTQLFEKFNPKEWIRVRTWFNSRLLNVFITYEDYILRFIQIKISEHSERFTDNLYVITISYV